MYRDVFISVQESAISYKPVCSVKSISYGSTYWRIQVCTAFKLYLHGIRRYKVVESGTRTVYGSTRRYKQVQGTVHGKKVQGGGTRLYKTRYKLVQGGTRTVVSSTYRYILVRTGMYSSLLLNQGFPVGFAAAILVGRKRCIQDKCKIKHVSLAIKAEVPPACRRG